MAKFTGGNLRLDDNQRVIWGDAADSSMWWDGVSLNIDTTISGVTPTESYHLATKEYIDVAISTVSGSGTILRGRAPISNDSSSVTVSFSDLGHTNYTINATLENTIDSPPSIYMFIVSTKLSNSFTCTLMGDTDSANYSLNWMVIADAA